MKMPNDDHTQAEIETIERATTSGVPVSVDPDVADTMGAFEEAALSAVEADNSRFDVDPATGIVLDDSKGTEGSHE